MSEGSRDKDCGGAEWQGNVFLGGARNVYLGHPGSTSRAHVHAVIVLLALESPLRLYLPAAGWKSVRSMVIPSEHVHALDARGAPAAVLYLHPEQIGSPEPERLCVREPAPLPRALEDRFRRPLRRRLGGAEHAEEILELTESLERDLWRVSSACLAPLDGRIGHLIETLENKSESISHAALARSVSLSPTRLTHLFREQTGISLRSYQLWMRARAMLPEICTGESLTNIAHAVGFADAAHLSRSSRRMLGVKLSELRRRAQFIGRAQNAPTHAK
jgi:AraC family transcriptional regulator